MSAVVREKTTTSGTAKAGQEERLAWSMRPNQSQNPPCPRSTAPPNCVNIAKVAEEFGQRRRTLMLIANQPRSYRQVISAALQALEPDIEVITTEPEVLEREVERLAPDLVICSQATETVRNADLSWIDLYPGGSNHAVIGVRGRRRRVSEPTLDDIFAVIDEVRRQPDRDTSDSV